PAQAPRERARFDEPRCRAAWPELPHPGTGDDAAASRRPAPDARGRCRPGGSVLRAAGAAARRGQAGSTRPLAAADRARSRTACARHDADVRHSPQAPADAAPLRPCDRPAPARGGRLRPRPRTQTGARPMNNTNANGALAEDRDDQDRDPRAPSHRSIARISGGRALTPSQLRDRTVIYRTDVARPEVDAFRDLRTKLLAMVDGNFVTLVVPVSRGCGGSFVARNLAAAMAFDETKSA